MKIHFLQPYSPINNIGKEYNEAIENLPDDDFCCICDQDTLKFEGFTERLYKIINKLENPKETLLGCLTNRLRLPNPQVIYNMYDVSNIDHHQYCANEAWNLFETKTKDVSFIAGTCMVFNIGYLKKLGGFKEGSITFDRQISREYLKAKGRVQIALGLYVFHLYRWGVEDPANQWQHLVEKKSLTLSVK